MAPHSFTELIALYESKADEYEGKAKEFRSMASNIRRDLAAFGISDKGIASNSKPPVPRPPFTREAVHKYLSERNARAQHISAVFAIPLSDVEKFIDDPANGLRDKGRGWLEIVSKDSAANNQPAEEAPV